MATAVVERSTRSRWLARRHGFLRALRSNPAAAVLVFGMVVTGLMASMPTARFAYENTQGRMALETTAALIGLFTVVLLVARFLASGSLADLGLAAGLAFNVAANLCYSVVPLAAGATPGHHFTTWAPLLARLLGAALFAVASFLPAQRLARPKVTAAWLAASLLAALVAIGVAVELLKGSLPAGLVLPPTTSLRPTFDEPVISVLQAVALTLNAVAAFGLARRFRRTSDEFSGWLSVGMAFGCCAALNFVLYPSLYSKWLYTGDAFRLASGVALLIGAVREIRRYWIDATKSAVLEERRRIARDLHDGIAQELAFISRRALRMEEDGSTTIQAAADRALAETRRTLAVLSRPLDEPFPAVLARALDIAGARGTIPVRLEMKDNIAVSPEVREALTMIAREAVSNAARHAGGTGIVVEVSNGGRETRLLVRDDGHGFDADAPTEGHGLRIMRERAEMVGGDFRLATRPGGGTTVEVTAR